MSALRDVQYDLLSGYRWRVDVGDSSDVLSTMPDGCARLIVADPPYNIDYGYDGYTDNLSDDEYFQWQYGLAAEISRVLCDGGSFFYLNYPEFASRMWCAWSEDWPGENRLVPQDIIAWVYHVHSSGSRLRKSYRNWLWFSKGEPIGRFTGVYRNPKDKRVAKLIAAGRSPVERDWWQFEQVKNVSKEKTSHPCQVPVAMLEKIVEGTTLENDLVVDIFAGSGSTGEAAVIHNRKFFGIELLPKYAEICESRISNAALRYKSQHPMQEADL